MKTDIPADGPAPLRSTRGALAHHTGSEPTHPRLRIETHRPHSLYATLEADVRQGMSAAQKALPPKYFYDDRGARLFDAICNLPEYYLTRTEQALLGEVAPEIIALTRPGALVELGSGTSRKTRMLLDAIRREGSTLYYTPMDLSEGVLRRSAHALLREYPDLSIHAVVGDYERELLAIPPGRNRLVVFLGSTIGNLSPTATVAFLAGLRGQLQRGDSLLLGMDLVKPVAVLEAAYNDAAGLTAEFNRNVLEVINRELHADFDLAGFEHIAFFNAQQSQIEMHLRARTACSVTIRDCDLAVRFAAGETIHTEISRKFTESEARAVLTACGFTVARWYAAQGNYFGLALARVT